MTRKLSAKMLYYLNWLYMGGEVPSDGVHYKTRNALIDAGWVMDDGDDLRLTDRGWAMMDERKR